jgi:hypothetical protein
MKPRQRGTARQSLVNSLPLFQTPIGGREEPSTLSPSPLVPGRHLYFSSSSSVFAQADTTCSAALTGSVAATGAPVGTLQGVETHSSQQWRTMHRHRAAHP